MTTTAEPIAAGTPCVRVLVDGVDVAELTSRQVAGALPGLPVEFVAGLLGTIERHVLDGPALDAVLEAEHRVVNWVQAGMAASICELALAPKNPAYAGQRLIEPDRFAAETVAAAMSGSPSAGGYALSRAWFAYRQMPAAWQAWRQGLLTSTKVRIFEDLLDGCSAEVVAGFEAAFLDVSTTDRRGRTALERASLEHNAAMRDRARRLIATLDPDAVMRRRKAREVGARFTTGGDSDGLGFFAASDLQFADVAEVDAFVTAVVDELIAEGDVRSKRELRAYVATCLLSGQAIVTEPGTQTAVAERDTRETVDAEEPDAGDDVEDNHNEPDEAEADCPDTSDHEPTAWPSPSDEPAADTWVWAPPPERGPPARPTPTKRRDRVSPAGTIELVVHADSLDPDSDELGWISRCGLIPADVTRELVRRAASAPADWCLTVVDGSGEVIRHARVHHDPTPAQRDHTEAVYRHCAYPGCRRGASRCDLDHRIPWESGGVTCACNLHPLCRRHHQLKQQPGWTVSSDGTTHTTTWISPNGRVTTGSPPAFDVDSTTVSCSVGRPPPS